MNTYEVTDYQYNTITVKADQYHHSDGYINFEVLDEVRTIIIGDKQYEHKDYLMVASFHKPHTILLVRVEE